MEREDAAGANALGNFAEGLSRVFHEMEDEAAYSGVEGRRWVERPSVRLPKLNVSDSLRGSPLLGELESFSVKIDSDHRTLRANQRSHEEANIADSTTNVEHAHAARNASCEQHPLRQRPKQLGLFDQPLVLSTRAAKCIVGVIH
jgi:hypothetical protein